MSLKWMRWERKKMSILVWNFHRQWNRKSYSVNGLKNALAVLCYTKSIHVIEMQSHSFYINDPKMYSLTSLLLNTIFYNNNTIIATGSKNCLYSMLSGVTYFLFCFLVSEIHLSWVASANIFCSDNSSKLLNKMAFVWNINAIGIWNDMNSHNTHFKYVI